MLRWDCSFFNQESFLSLTGTKALFFIPSCTPINHFPLLKIINNAIMISTHREKRCSNINCLGGDVMKLKNVQSIICLAIFFLFANQAWAADWVLYESSDTGDLYYDKSSIKKVNENIVSVLTKQILNENGKTRYFSFLKMSNKAPEKPDLLSYKLILSEIDCVNKKIKSSPMTIYDEADNVIYSTPVKYDEWSGIVPNTIAAKLKNKVCAAGKSSKSKKK
jgi:hypothetical protein